MTDIRPDWTNLPAEIIPLSLWPSLHDAHLRAVTSDYLIQTTTLTIHNDYLNDFHHFAEDTTFQLLLTAVTSSCASAYVMWPGEFDAPAGISREEHNRLVQDYHAKWRVQSVGWETLEAMLATGKTYIDISGAQLAEHEGRIGLKVEGLLELDDMYQTLVMQAGGLEISDSAGNAYTLAEFLALGEAYWNAFSARRPA